MSKHPSIQLVDEDDASVNDGNIFQKFDHRHHVTERMSGHLIEADTVFLYYQDAGSYYAAGGLRGLLRV
jgi:hypothetical protein